VNPERPWPDLDRLRAATEAAGKALAPRLTVYPEYVRDADTWLHPDVRTPVWHVSDLEGLARDDAWASGGDAEPPILVPGASPARAGGPVGAVLDGVARGEEIGFDEIVTLLGARGPEIGRVAEVADELRREIVGDDVTFVRNRNINYTNVCTFKCKFCAFSKGPLSLNLRGTPYLLELEEMQNRVLEAVLRDALSRQEALGDRAATAFRRRPGDGAVHNRFAKVAQIRECVVQVPGLVDGGAGGTRACIRAGKNEVGRLALRERARRIHSPELDLVRSTCSGSSPRSRCDRIHR